MKEILGGVTVPAGFSAGAIRCGIKKKGCDMALLYSQKTAAASGMFTSNKMQAAPVILSRENLRNGKVRAIIINSGNANACTGKRGYKDAKTMAKLAADELGIKPGDVLAASTGVIGKFLPMDKFPDAVRRLAKKLNRHGGTDAARAIMTTDSVVKENAVRFSVDGVNVAIGAMAKGSGMIYPLMATMLCFVTTDASVSKPALDAALRNSVEKSFHRITVDGDRSTNDTVLLLANGFAGNREISVRSKSFNKFQKALDRVMIAMAKMIVRDGEGAEKFIEIEVRGARSVQDAKKIGFSIANSNLVKTALAGENPNWGRIASAAGSSGAGINEEKLSIFIGNERVMKSGAPAVCNAGKVKRHLKKDEIRITVCAGGGNKSCTVWTTDLTEEYIRINKGYS